MMRVLIKHSTGSKANRIEQFSIDSSEDISLGRDSTAMVTYDPERDDLVSRRHALIRTKKDGELSFTIEDLQSRNGTFVNGERLTGEQELLPGDVVELGAGGPKFTFDVEPRLPHLMPRTKMGHDEQRPGAAPELATAGGTASEPAPYKVGVGRSTVVDMLSEQFNRAHRNWMYILAGVLTLIVVVGAGLYYQNLTAERRMTDKFIGTVKRGEVTGKMTPKDIASAYGGSTVLIESEWRLLDRQSGKQVFLKRIPKDSTNREFSPAYVRLKDNSKIVRWLMLDNEGNNNEPIRQKVKGSGFVVRDDGFILTNRHVAAPWEYPYYFACECNAGDGWLYQEGSVEGPQWFQPRLEIADPDNEFYHWVPTKTSVVFDDEKPTRLRREELPFQARSDHLEIRLPGNSVPFDARFIRADSRADVALIKTDPPDPIKPIPLADPSSKLALGEPITVVGYPGVSMQTFEFAEWIEAGRRQSDIREIAQPTVVEGIISNISVGILHSGGNVITIGTVGEAYQMSVTATGPGNSGGPVLDSNGAVVGILSFMKSGGAGELVFFAIPIKAGNEILKLK